VAFVETLRDLVDGIDGAIAATVMGTDGLAVAEYEARGARYDIETVGIEYGKVIDEIKNASNLLALGSVEEVYISTQGTGLYLRILTPEYYLAFVVDSGVSPAKAKYRMRRAATRVRRELLS